MAAQQQQHPRSWRERMHEIIFEADTLPGKAFDVVLIWSILLSVLVVMLDSVSTIRSQHGALLYGAEWFFTLLFTLEYLLRLLCIGRPWRYAGSFFGIVDLLAILPTYLSLLVPGTQYLQVVRILRVLRIFRILKFVEYSSEARLLMRALHASKRKIFVFLFTVLTLVVIIGALMYLIEGPANGFTSIPRSMYWTIVTMTTVGYGDISPRTDIGQMFAAGVMILGYSIIAVPTGIVTVSMGQVLAKPLTTQSCPQCSAEGHDSDALHCKFCGSRL